MIQKLWNICNLWFVRWTSPKWFYPRAKTTQTIVATLSIILLGVGLVWGLFFAPADYLQGDSFRIIYVHVPAASVAQSSYLFLAIAGFIYLVWRVKLAAIFMVESVYIGFVFAILTLITGAIWGKPTWGTYWFWDARLVSSTVLVFLFLAIVLILQTIQNTQKATMIASYIAILGVLNIPIIKYSVDWWYTLHQADTFSLTQKAKMQASMWLPLLLTVLGTYCFYATAVLKRMTDPFYSKEQRQ